MPTPEQLHRCQSTYEIPESLAVHVLRCSGWKGHPGDHYAGTRLWPNTESIAIMDSIVNRHTTELAPQYAAAIDSLCELLAAFVAEFQGDPNSRPNWQTVRWRTDMRLLLERGPGGRAKPEPLSVERVAHTLKIIFREMATPKPGTTFCWAAQVRSPGSLREKWDRIGAAYKLEIASNTPRASVMTEGVFKGAFGGDN